MTTRGRGLAEVTASVQAAVQRSGVREGLCTLLIQHTSASLLIQENADPSARCDLERWLDRLVPEDGAQYTHTAEGPDDTPAYIKAALTTTLLVPIADGRSGLGTWQGIYVWEHRRRGGSRHVLLHLSS